MKGYPAKNKSFNDYDTAYIWGKYQEMVTKEKDDFGVQPQDMYTVLDLMVAKYGHDSREMRDCEEPFKTIDIWHTYICKLDYETLMKHAKTLLSTYVFRGGKKGSETGIKKLPQPMTVLRKFAYLSSAINDMVKKGVDLPNHTLKVIAFLRELDKEKKNGKAE